MRLQFVRLDFSEEEINLLFEILALYNFSSDLNRGPQIEKDLYEYVAGILEEKGKMQICDQVLMKLGKARKRIHARA